MGAWLAAHPVAYILLNASHILGIALLLGSILPLDLRLAGAFRRVPLDAVTPFLRAVAATGLMLAAVAGVLLFSVNPAAYLANPAFQAKLALLSLAVANAAVADALLRRLPAGAEPPPALRALALLSLVLWLAVLLSGRWIGFL